jgi:hypothetical protein
MGITWFGYSVALWGYCLIKGYNVTLAKLVNPVHPFAATWPPPANIPTSDVFPPGAGDATEGADPGGTALL